MKKTTTPLAEIKLVGLAVRTNNTLESDPASAKIGLTLQRFFGENWPQKIKHRKNPSRTLGVYTHYESDLTGNYTYFIGEEVTSFEGLAEGLGYLVLPAQAYVKFTSEAGPMPKVVIDLWQNIWKMSASDLGGKRAYLADFEVYDERSHDLKNATLDIYIGVK